jgi:hypothetical protein
MMCKLHHSILKTCKVSGVNSTVLDEYFQNFQTTSILNLTVEGSNFMGPNGGSQFLEKFQKVLKWINEKCSNTGFIHNLI